MSTTGRTGRSDVDDARNRLMGAGLVDDPYPQYHELRSKCPVVSGSVGQLFGVPGPAELISAGTPTYSTFGFAETIGALRNHRRFSSEWYQPSLEATVGRTLIGLDPPEHQRLRSLLQAAFSVREMQRWEHEIVRRVVDGYLDPMVAAGRGDLYRDFAAHVPIHVTAVALGLPAEDHAMFVDWAVVMTSPLVPIEERLTASRAVADYIAPLVAERRAQPHTDLLGVLVRAQVPDDDDSGLRQPLSDQELADFTRLLIVAGASTVYRAYGILLFALLSNPDQLEAVRGDRSLLPQAVEESLRWEQPLAFFGRTVTADTSLGGVDLPKGCALMLDVGAANHDPAIWPDPEHFDIFRESQPHLSFGFGRHRCLGINLARMELRVMLEETLDRFPDLELDPGQPGVHITGLQFRMVTGLPVRWNAGAARSPGTPTTAGPDHHRHASAAKGAAPDAGPEGGA